MNLPVRMPAAFTGREARFRTANNPDLRSLTPMQDRFIEEYLIDLDPRQAAVRAGTPIREAATRARSWMGHPLVREAIGRAMAERSRRVGLNADRVLQRLGALAFGDPTAIFNEHGGLRKPGEMDEHDRLLIAGVKTRRTMALDDNGQMQPEEIVEVKVIDQVAVLNMAMKHLGMMNERVDVNITSLADRLREAQLRRAGKLPNGSTVIEDAEYEELDDGNGCAPGDGDVEELEAGPEDHAPSGAPAALAAPTPSLLDYDPITGEPVIDWDPLQ